MKLHLICLFSRNSIFVKYKINLIQIKMSSNYFKTYPNKNDFFNEYGGAYIPPHLGAEMKNIFSSIKSSAFVLYNVR